MKKYPKRADNESVVDHPDLISEGTPISNHVDSAVGMEKSESKEEDDIAKNETKNVNIAKAVAACVLICSATIIAVMVYYYMTASEYNEFEDQFINDSEKVLDSIGASVVNSLSVLDNFAFVAVSLAKFFGQDKGIPSWPYLNIPDFGIRAAKTRASCNGITFSFQPIIRGLEERVSWENYAWNTSNQYWVNQSKQIQETDENFFGTSIYNVSERKQLWNRNGDIPYTTSQDIFLPQWQNYPAVSPCFNRDWLSSTNAKASYTCIQTHHAVLSEAYMLPDPNNQDEIAETEYWGNIFRKLLKPDEEAVEPVSDLIYPIIEVIDGVKTPDSTGDKIVATVVATIYWREYIKKVLPENSKGIVVVFENPCNPSFTYQINGPKVVYLGRGDLHNPKYNSLKKSRLLTDLQYNETKESRYSGVELDVSYCPFTINVYPSEEMENIYESNKPAIFTSFVVLIFIFTMIVFFVYDASVERRQKSVMRAAEKTNAIVSSLFPEAIRDQIMEAEKEKKADGKKTFDSLIAHIGNSTNTQSKSSRPIADLYPETTVFFADLAGFTAWSSTRNPSQVFILLETLYGAMDQLAKTRKVFKIETVGDCYVAVTGLPEPLPNHAVIMARFANDCIDKTNILTSDLVTTLGPETADLRLRVGLNSGPTTAGVLRGEKARFQLFGDTVNTAARMESNGKPGRIHASQKTADLLVEAGKSSWVTLREDLISVKGKGIMKTFWVHPKRTTTSSFGSGESVQEPSAVIKTKETEISRLVDWNVDVFSGLLKRIAANRSISKEKKSQAADIGNIGPGVPLDEITESVELLLFSQAALDQIDINKIELGPKVEDQLRDYIGTIAHMYRDNHFHNFEHASHVVMSTTKLIQRIELPHTSVLLRRSASVTGEQHDSQHIALDPLSQFAIVFAALVHDVDHFGLPNFQLIAEEAPIAVYYKGKNVAEQNSIDVAWKLLMQPHYDQLQKAIFETHREAKHFRNIVVNCVLATDIFDKYLKGLRDSRWSRTFAEHETVNPGSEEGYMDRKAAIVIEHVIQASDVCHTMQHWMIYQKWNGRLFNEMYKAYKTGRSTKNPKDGWYDGELWFFDNYIIPLARKLKVCGVFGVSCDEFLDYAQDNRLEWESKGRSITKELAEKAEALWEMEEILPIENSPLGEYEC